MCVAWLATFLRIVAHVFLNTVGLSFAVVVSLSGLSVREVVASENEPGSAPSSSGFGKI